MANVYVLDKERNLILYPSGQNIFLGTSSGKAFTRTVSLCSDYSQHLSDVIYKNTIYFSYQNSHHDIIVRNITDTEPVFQIAQQEIPDCFAPQLFSFHNDLLLFYSIKNPLDDTYLLKSVFPMQKEKKLNLSVSFSDVPMIYPLISGTKAFLSIIAGTEISFWQIHNSQKISRLSLMDENTPDDKLLHEISRLQKELSIRDTMLESAKHQYNELMETATKYREEAIKWRSKFLSN